jgi:hypothetical protein
MLQQSPQRCGDVAKKRPRGDNKAVAQTPGDAFGQAADVDCQLRSKVAKDGGDRPAATGSSSMIRTLWRRAIVASACRRSSSKVMVVGLWEPRRPNPPPSGPLCSPGAGLSRSKRGPSRSTPSGPLAGPLGGGDSWLACRRPRKTARHFDSERNRACNRRRPVAARAAAGRATGASHSGLNRPSFGRAEGPSPGRSRDKQPSPLPTPYAAASRYASPGWRRLLIARAQRV